MVERNLPLVWKILQHMVINSSLPPREVGLQNINLAGIINSLRGRVAPPVETTNIPEGIMRVADVSR